VFLSFLFSILRNHYLILSRLRYGTPYSRRHLDALLRINVLRCQKPLQLRQGHSWYSCSHKVNETVFDFRREKWAKIWYFWHLRRCRRRQKDFCTFFGKNVVSLWGQLFVTWRCFDWLHVFSLILFWLFCCFLHFVYILYVICLCRLCNWLL
jgi:hypothetical protein